MLEIKKFKKFIEVLKWFYNKYDKPLSLQKYELIKKTLELYEEYDFNDEFERKTFLSIEEYYQKNNIMTESDFKKLQILEIL